jgi:hypothetical protein
MMIQARGLNYSKSFAKIASRDFIQSIKTELGKDGLSVRDVSQLVRIIR